MAKPLYRGDWRAKRAWWNAELTRLGSRPCRRCGQPVYPDHLAHLNRDGAPFDLFSDIDSKIAHLRRIEVLVLAVLLVQVTTAASLLHRGGFLPEMLPIAVLWAAIMILMACGFVRIARKLRRLKRERAVRE